MTQILIVVAAAVLTFFLFGGVIKVTRVLASTTFEVLGFNVPALFVLFVSLTLGSTVWMLYEAFGIKTVAVAGAVTIEALAFYSLSRSGASNGSASLWLFNAFALGGLFILCVALLA